MSFEETAVRVMIFISEDDRLHHHGLHEVLVNKAREYGVIGATVYRGIEGFGSSGRIRTLRFPDATTGLPLIVEFIDNAERIHEFLSIVSELTPRSLVTKEEIRITRAPSSASQ